MKIRQFVGLLCSIAALTAVAGCGGGDSRPPRPADRPPLDTSDDDEGFSLKIPGIVDVKTGEDGVSVKTPVADVDVDDEGTKVEALGTELEAK